MSLSKITLIGFNNYYEHLWDELSLPSGINKEILISNILLRGGEFEVLYSDPVFMMHAIGVWSNKWNRTFEKWLKALSEEYNPLHNYDRHEIYTDTHSEDEKISRVENAVASDNSNSSGSGNTENKVSAYDVSTYQPHDEADTSSTGHNESNSNTTATGNNNRNTSGTIKHDAHLYGNIGVTTSQQMLKDELDIDTWNIYEHITDLFLNEFAIYIY